MTEKLSRRSAVHRLVGLAAVPILAACGADRLLSPRPSTLDIRTDRVILIGAGDQHAVATNAAHRTGAAVRTALEAAPDAWAFAVGDLVPNGTAEEYRHYNRAWGAFKDRTFFAMGNHDRKADPSAGAYYDYVGNRGGPRGKGYYAVTLGAWRCYVLNSEAARSQEQLDWLAGDLPNWTGYHIMAMWHSPMFASACVHAGRPMTGRVAHWWQLLQDHGAEFVVSGHVHRWERFARMLRDGTVSNQGLRQFIVGTGGVRPMEVLAAHPRSECRIVTRGVARFDLYPDRYEWSLTSLDGTVLDNGTQITRTA